MGQSLSSLLGWCGDFTDNLMVPGLVASKLADVCQVQKLIGNDAAGEAGCWAVSAWGPLGDRIEWDVIHYNEG